MYSGIGQNSVTANHWPLPVTAVTAVSLCQSHLHVPFSAAGMFTFGSVGATAGGATFLTGAAVAVAVGRAG